MRCASLKKRSSEKWRNFKEKHPRIKKLKDNFSRVILYQIPTIGMLPISLLAINKEYLTYLGMSKQDLPSDMVLFPCLVGSAALLLVIRTALRKKQEEKQVDKYVTRDLIGGSGGGWAVDIAAVKTITNQANENILLGPPTSFIAGNIGAYLAIAPMWYLLHRNYFKRLKNRKRVKQSLWRRLKYGFAMGFQQSVLFAAIEKVTPDSKMVGKIKELKEEGQHYQKTYETDCVEDMIELLGISRGIDWFLFPIRFLAMGVIVALNGDNNVSYACYSLFYLTSEVAYSLSWKTAGIIELFKPRAIKGSLDSINSEKSQ